jgi:hypothetical protein
MTKEELIARARYRVERKSQERHFSDENVLNMKRAYEIKCEHYESKIKELEAQIEKMKWHKLDWDKMEENPDVDKLVRVRTKSGEEYICQTYLYYPTEDEIGYGSAIIQFEELNGDWVDDNEIEYWCYIEPFKEIKETEILNV